MGNRRTEQPLRKQMAVPTATLTARLMAKPMDMATARRMAKQTETAKNKSHFRSRLAYEQRCPKDYQVGIGNAKGLPGALRHSFRAAPEIGRPRIRDQVNGKHPGSNDASGNVLCNPKNGQTGASRQSLAAIFESEEVGCRQGFQYDDFDDLVEKGDGCR